MTTTTQEPKKNKYVYGTLLDFIWRYPCRTTVPLILYILLLSFVIYKFYIKMENWNLETFKERFVVTSRAMQWDCLIVIISSVIFIIWFINVYVYGRRRFVKQHGLVVYFDRLRLPKYNNNNNNTGFSAGLSPPGMSTSVYMQCCDQTSINTPVDFEKERFLAASTPLPFSLAKGDGPRFTLPSVS